MDGWVHGWGTELWPTAMQCDGSRQSTTAHVMISHMTSSHPNPSHYIYDAWDVILHTFSTHSLRGLHILCILHTFSSHSPHARYASALYALHAFAPHALHASAPHALHAPRLSSGAS
eukprot:62087-Chlamydomonas_euryale.AAC.1